VTSLLPRIQNALSKRARRMSKHMYQSIRWRALDRPRILMIVGCQRSGTTLMGRLFDADRDCRVFGEYSVLSCVGKDGIRLNPLPDVAAVLSRVPAPLVVTKPLVETQRVRTLLNYFPNAKALFMYRNYSDVASSDLRKFGTRNALENIRPIATGNTHNWRSAGASTVVRERVAHFFSESMSPNDAAALFWYARNQLFYDNDLAGHGDVMLCRYEHLVTDPVAVMRRIYEFSGAACPDLSHTRQVHSSSVTKGRNLELLPEVRALCDQLQARMDAHYEAQARMPASANASASAAVESSVPRLQSPLLQ
jgi:Sulfotransferase domain